MVKQILLASSLGNVKRTVRRIYILMLGCKGLVVLVVVELVNSIEEKGRKFLKHSMLNETLL